MKIILIYDLNVLPEDSVISVDKVMEIYQNENILFWDSRRATPEIDCSPKIYNVPKGVVISILDLNSEEGKKELERFKQ